MEWNSIQGASPWLFKNFHLSSTSFLGLMFVVSVMTGKVPSGKGALAL